MLCGSSFGRLISDLHSAGLVTVGRDGKGQATWILTDEGTHLAGLVTAWDEDGPTGRVGSLLDAFARSKR
jgi:hypothetical protein